MIGSRLKPISLINLVTMESIGRLAPFVTKQNKTSKDFIPTADNYYAMILFPNRFPHLVFSWSLIIVPFYRHMFSLVIIQKKTTTDCIKRLVEKMGSKIVPFSLDDSKLVKTQTMKLISTILWYALYCLKWIHIL